MPAGSICGSRVRYADYERCLTCATPGYYSQCRSDTTSTVVKAPLVRALAVGMLSGTIPSIRLYLYLYLYLYTPFAKDIEYK